MDETDPQDQLDDEPVEPVEEGEGEGDGEGETEPEDQGGDGQQDDPEEKPDEDPKDTELGHPEIPVEPVNPTDPALPGTDDDGAPVGVIVGVSAGVAVLLLAAIAYCVIRKRKQQGSQRLFTELDQGGINGSVYQGDVVSDDGARLGTGGSYQRDVSVPTTIDL